jgi:hypothetical protein
LNCHCIQIQLVRIQIQLVRIQIQLVPSLSFSSDIFLQRPGTTKEATSKASQYYCDGADSGAEGGVDTNKQ